MSGRPQLLLFRDQLDLLTQVDKLNAGSWNLMDVLGECWEF